MEEENKNNSTSTKKTTVEETTTEKAHKKNKKLIVAIVIIILLVVIAASVGGYFIFQNIENNKSVGTTWGDTYYAYLKEASLEQDLGEREKYGMQSNMENTQIQFCEIEEGETPAMIMTYTKDGSEYVNTYKISEDNKVINVAYKEPSTVEFLYNISLQQYIWYIHIQTGTQDSYKPISLGFEELNNQETSSENLTNNTNVANSANVNSTNATDTANATNTSNTENISNVTNSINVASEDITKVELTPEYTFAKDEVTTVETVDGETLSISKFDETFVKPETDVSQKVDLDINSMDEKVIKDAVTSTVAGYKPESAIVTDEVKATVDEKVTEVEIKQEEIKTAQEEKAKKEEEERKAEEARKAAEEAAKGLKVGNCTLKYGTYVSDVAQMSGNDEPMSATLVLNQDGTFSLNAVNLSESDFLGKKSQNCTGTYKVKLNQETYPGEYENMIEFTPSNGEALFYFTVSQNNAFHDQWHGYSYTGS